MDKSILTIYAIKGTPNENNDACPRSQGRQVLQRKVTEELWAAKNIHQFVDMGMVMWEYTGVKIHQIKT